MIQHILILTHCVFQLIETWGFSALLLFMRFWLARIWWYSGLVKLDDMETTIDLFREEYTVPLLSPELAAYLATGTELIAPVLLLTGFMARIGAASVFVMAAIIQIWTYQHVEHLYWLMISGVIFLYGPGRFSLDQWIRTRLLKS